MFSECVQQECVLTVMYCITSYL